MKGRERACASAAAFTGALLINVSAAPVYAQQLPDPLTVTGQRIGAAIRVVPYGDLSLANDTGRNTLLHRVRAAVADVCPAYDATFRVYDAAGCQDFAWARAKPQINR